MTEPCSPGAHSRSFTGESGQMRDRYTALWPEPVIRATLVSSDSLRTIPTSARAGPEQKREPESSRAMKKGRFKAVLFPHEFSIHQDAGARSQSSKTRAPVLQNLDAGAWRKVTRCCVCRANTPKMPGDMELFR